MKNNLADDIFRTMVDKADTAVLYTESSEPNSLNAKEYLVKYANHKAQSFFSISDDTNENQSLEVIVKYDELLIMANKVLKTEEDENFNIIVKEADSILNYHVRIRLFNKGLLFALSLIKPKFITDKESKLPLGTPQSRNRELEISNLFGIRVLDSNDSIICYLKPIFNKKGDVEDFRIDYINNRMGEIAKDDSAFIEGQTILEYYPKNSENGVLEILADCYTSGENKEYTKEFIFDKECVWLTTKAVKMNDGLILFSKDVTKEKRYEAQLFIQNRLLSEAEHVANIGSFRWNLAEDQIKYSDNVYRLFGYDPNEFDNKYDRLLTFLHPNDFEKVKSSFKEARKNKSKSDLVFRVYTKFKELRYMNTIGECYQKEGNWYMVGVIRDVTKQIEAESVLQIKNSELKRTNADLEAFNRVASHDLQEPLRKIQMFVSRLDEEEEGRLNYRSQGYLSKIKYSSDRMRNLINNLLSYSKIDEVGEQPRRVDLNDVLNNVLEDLGERINDLGAKVESVSLPVVNGIQFQLEQLFANLIGNSLKYVNEGVQPNIKIIGSIVSGDKSAVEGLLPNINYVKLQFIDNGIGFEKKYQEKIFEIFQRLHGKTEFSGTGLGLSICKKIVQSHNGTITAKGEMNKGAEFIVYLPTLL
ncbi:phospho-acceptor domain-containing protein [Maribacter caenipelagi]|uniref:histidine kinase n=1 Tax=Maribacter caenipelagi TaxID=1447781 RepID=A0A4V3E163_9FLAO|nr:PAS domain-containing sensor histidine kinase [Maribacter caenipelagi]TDS12028.1 phospho-acceptor domain-containing protein [Maribacter caenipelagi]